MIKNYLLIAARNIQRNSFYSLINILGLSTGIACAVLIFLWVSDELSFDKFHSRYKELYKVHMNQELSGVIQTGTTVPFPLADALKVVSPHIRHVAITNYGEGNLLAAGSKKVNKVGNCVGPDYLKMFSFNFLKGDSLTALEEPYSIVLTKSTSKALFGDDEPLGKYITIDNFKELKVTGVISDVSAQSTNQFDYLIAFGFYEATQGWVKNSKENWNNNSFQLYVELDDSKHLEEVNTAIKDLVKKNNSKANTNELFLHPMAKWRLHSQFENGKVAGGKIQSVQWLLALGVFIMIIACINFMNLATARSESRAREVGIRKSVGSRRNQLVFQFLSESILTALISFMLAIIIVELVLPSYNILVNKQLSIDYADPLLWMAAAGLVLFTGAVAGSYPAFYLSSFLPVNVLKGKVRVEHLAIAPRKVLVSLQYGFTIFLIIGTFVIWQQILHVKDREIGYDRENLMLIWTNSEIETSFQTIKDELKRTGVVKGVCKSNSPITRVFSSTDLEWPGKPADQKVSFTSIATEYDYTETMGIKMLEGRDFSPEFKSDTAALIINRSALETMGLQEPVGATVRMWGREWTIIGVMENVVMDSPYHPVQPLVMMFSPEWSSTITIRLEKTKDLERSIATVEDVFKRLNPNYPLWYRFADAEFDSKFAGITLITRLATIFASLAIFITCLGLFGLAAFTAEQRRKELGIRKVLGASVAGLIMLISKDFSRLVIYAFLVTAPIAWWVVNKFLDRYPYRIQIDWWILPLTGLLALALTLVIVSTQAYRAARANPIESLRSE